MNEMRTVSKIHRVLTAASTRVKKKELGDNKQHSHSEWRSSTSQLVSSLGSAEKGWTANGTVGRTASRCLIDSA